MKGGDGVVGDIIAGQHRITDMAYIQIVYTCLCVYKYFTKSVVELTVITDIQYIYTRTEIIQCREGISSSTISSYVWDSLGCLLLT